MCWVVPEVWKRKKESRVRQRKKRKTQENDTEKKRENKETGLCTLQIKSKVPARRGIVLECMLQQHTK